MGGTGGYGEGVGGTGGYGGGVGSIPTIMLFGGPERSLVKPV